MNRLLILLLLLIAAFARPALAIDTPESVGMVVQSARLLSAPADTTNTLAAAHKQTNWQTVSPHWIDTDIAVFVYEMVVNIRPSSSDALYINLLGASEIYWDGQLIFSNGKPALAAVNEVPGRLDNLIPLAANLRSPGLHTISFFVSRHHLAEIPKRSYLDLSFTNFQHYQQQQQLDVLIPMVSFGAMLIMALYFFTLYQLDQKIPVRLAFALLCLMMAALLLAESWRPLFSYTYDWHVPRLVLVAICTFVVAVLLPLVLMLEYRIKVKISQVLPIIILYIMVNLLIPSYDVSAYLSLLLSIFLSVILTLKPLKARDFSAIPVLAAALINLCIALLNSHQFNEQWLFLSFDLLILAMLIRLALSMKALRLAYLHAEIKTERIKTMFLKQCIQPHFLMNTLTSLSEWIEEDPKTANKLIEALAEEFRLLNKVIDCHKVEFAEELELVHLHLQVMSIRREVNFQLAVDCDDVSFTIAPGILHSLVENALSHNRYRQSDIIFKCAVTRSESARCISFTVPLGDQVTRQGSGMGFSYIRARLQELGDDNWHLSEHLTDSEWRVDIRIPL